jgi:hypothetical protein
MKKNSTLLFAVFVAAISISAFAQVNNHFGVIEPDVLNGETPEWIPNADLNDVPTKAEALKKAKEVIFDGTVIRVYANYKYNRNGTLVQKTKYSYDANGRNNETITYIINDYSQSWMYGREKWIIFTKTNRESTFNGSILSYESYSLDMTSGILKGTSKYKYTRFEVEQFVNSYEYYSWDNTNNEWKGSSKYDNTNVLSGNEITTEKINWTWNVTSKQWEKNITTKYAYKYRLEDGYWFSIESKTFSFIDGTYICTAETLNTPNIELKTNQSSEQKTYVAGALVNSYKYIYSFNTFKKIYSQKYSNGIINGKITNVLFIRTIRMVETN